MTGHNREKAGTGKKYKVNEIALTDQGMISSGFLYCPCRTLDQAKQVVRALSLSRSLSRSLFASQTVRSHSIREVLE